MTGLNSILIGAAILLAAAAVGATAILSPKRRAAFVYAQLCVMVGIYVGFALVALDAADFVGRAELSIVTTEAVVALIFMFAGLGVLHTARSWLLGGLILAHGGVDLMHLLFGAEYSPDWYEFACILYDAIVGVATIWLLSQKPAAG